jgi:hypothetical protein
VEPTTLDLLLWARLHAAGLPVPADRSWLWCELELHLVRQRLLRRATAELGPGDPPSSPPHLVRRPHAIGLR